MRAFSVFSGLFDIVHAGAKPDSSKTDGKKQLKIIQDPQYRRFGNTVDMNTALELFVPNGLVWTYDNHRLYIMHFVFNLRLIYWIYVIETVLVPLKTAVIG